ncbi:MAG: hypothetical protein HYW63_01645 [Candidatus Levybacteria bacterium]|nr:hypothetical protein [Candidatus Levybacteria bacterium]
MPTLSNFRAKFLSVAKWLGIIIAILVVSFILIRIIFLIKEAVSPTPPPAPTASFGKLPKIFFPEGIKKKFTFTIDTISGELPSFPDRSNVYKMDKPGPDLLAVQRTMEKAIALDFNSTPQALSESLYRFTAPGPPPKSLVLNINMSSFNLYSSYLSDPGVLSAVNLPNENEAISVAQNFLQTLGFFSEDIDQGKTRTEFYDLNNGILGPVTNISKAKLISVYFFQKDIDDIVIVYPNGNASVMNLVVARGESGPQIVNARFFYQKVLDEGAAYPIKTAQEAFEDLRKGEAYIASYEGTDLNIVIKKVYLGFYVEGRSQDYLLPVIVFEGANDFIAYVSAVKAEWISN